MKNDKQYWFWALLLPLVILALDQLSKAWVLKFFKVPHNICALNPYPGLQYEISPIVDLALVCNRGVSFGMFQSQTNMGRIVLTAFAALMVLALLIWLKNEKTKLTRFALSLIIGGAVGNAIDRGLYGAVTDFINFSDIGFKWVFNVADSAISVGVACLILSLFLQSKVERKASDTDKLNSGKTENKQ